MNQALHFGPQHPLADVAARFCHDPIEDLIGGVACGQCWEKAIRDDERVAAEFGLPRELKPDPAYVDDIAVELACRGERVPLSSSELTIAVRYLHAKGLLPIDIARRLRVTYGAAVAALAAERQMEAQAA